MASARFSVRLQPSFPGAATGTTDFTDGRRLNTLGPVGLCYPKEAHPVCPTGQTAGFFVLLGPLLLQEVQAFTNDRAMPVSDSANPGRPASEQGRERDGLLLTGSPQSLGFQCLVQGFAGVARALDGFLAEGKAAVHGGSRVAPRGATSLSGPCQNESQLAFQEGHISIIFNR